MNTLVSHVPDSTRERILACQREADWDDDGAEAITRQQCEASLAFLEKLIEADPTLPMPSISPSVFGTITLSWRRQDAHLFVRVSDENEDVFYQSEEPGISRSSGYESAEQVQHRILSLFHYDMRYQPA